MYYYIHLTPNETSNTLSLKINFTIYEFNFLCDSLILLSSFRFVFVNSGLIKSNLCTKF